MFSEQDDYLLRIDNINASGEDLINISINVVPEFRFDIVAVMKTMLLAAIIFVIKSRIGSLRRTLIMRDHVFTYFHRLVEAFF
jgi:hypothetical protein